ncbi:MAG: DUF6786 family protein [Chitinophagaceae bacterium]
MRSSNTTLLILITIATLIGASCGNELASNERRTKKAAAGTYAYDRSFLKKQLQIIELTNDRAKILLVPQYQGRVMTSTCSGDTGASFGWINYQLIQSGKVLKHMNAYGGEERLWLGPEGGQFAVFFKENVPFEYEHWFTPKELDTAAFEVTAQTAKSVVFQKKFQLVNRSGTLFKIGIERKVRILPDTEVESRLHTRLPYGVQAVAYESQNILTNKGRSNWEKESGLLSIWMLGMLKPSPSTIIAIPVKEGDEKELGPIVHDNYFGAIPPDRLFVNKSALFLKADGKQRGKLGIPPLRVQQFIGSYDEASNTLTLLESTVPEGEQDYVNSAWQQQEDPYSGDVFNAYNDGPLADGSQMGPFYELESSSPGAKLEPGKSLNHRQVTYHITGNEKTLDEISRNTLGISIAEIKSAFRK